jgi:peptide deformylase
LAVLRLRFAGDLVLRQKTRAVKKIDASVQRLIDDMIDTLHAAHGVGLAAPQVGRSERVAVIGMPDEDVIVLINPQIVKRSGRRCVEEGCLSVPGYVADITRSESVTVKALNREGHPFRVKAKDDLLAQALEHEMDHLEGVLYIDYLESPDQLISLESREEAAVADEGLPVARRPLDT